MQKIFISSVQKELADERAAIRDYVRGDALLRRFFEVFLFEDLPASDRRADKVYLEEVERCDVYVGIFANEYSYEDHEGLSPTEREFEHATIRGKPRLVFVKGTDDKLRWFLSTARRERQYVLTESTPIKEALAHLNVLHDGKPSHAAILLFGNQPQRFLITSEVKCLHFHGTEVQKPIPSYQTYKGTVFDLVDQAVDFVMSKIARAVGTRAAGPQALVTYELPRDAVAEAIVNAVVHRDYASNASVQVMLFADRLEVWNPGELPPSLTPELLRKPHSSIPRNPLIAEPMFLAHYIEKAGTGTLDMISLCRKAGLPEPDFRQNIGQWVVTFWRDWLADEFVSGLELNERQTKAMVTVRRDRSITNAVYRSITGTSRPTAKRDLEDLVNKGVLVPIGSGRGARYDVARKWLTNGSNGSRGGRFGNGS